MNTLPKRVVVVAGYARSLLHFRGPLLEALREAGHQVIAVAPEHDPMAQESAQEIAAHLGAMGIHYRPIRMSRTGMNPRDDLATLGELRKLMQELRPDVVFSYTIKAVIYGSLAAKMVGVPQIVAMVTGLGYAFTDPIGNVQKKALQVGLQRLYKMAFKVCDRVIFQNPDDRDELVALGLLPQEKTALVNGSGLDLAYYAPQPLPPNPAFLMIARLTPEKGVGEYVEAIRKVREQLPDATFGLLGPLDYSPGAYTETDIARWQQWGVDYLGETKDVRPYIKAASVFVLPSYREGTPRTVLEAMAMGRPVITTDAPGCRETVEEGVNGYLVPVKDIGALAERMLKLAHFPELRARMGALGRERAVEKYDVHAVNRRMMELLGLSTVTGHRTKWVPYDVMKRVLDLCLAGAGLIVLALPMGVIAAAVRWQLGSPVIYTHVRPGRYGRPFKLYKFRSMTNERDKDGRLLPDAQRLIPFGHFLRSSSLDELPELWNVLKGDMSLVGPRPLVMEYLPYYTEEQQKRHEVRPGLTGLAQVSGRNYVPFSRRLEMDVDYVRTLSLRNDLIILLKTISVVFSRSNISRGESVKIVDDIGLSRDLDENFFKD